MKKGLLLVVLLGLMLILSNIGMTVTNTLLRSAGTAGSGIVLTIDTSDTNASGYMAIADTTYSDTVDLESYKYANILIHLYDFDTGNVLDNDSVNDTIIVRTVTCAGRGEPKYVIFTDTFLNVPDSAWHKFFLDTTALTNIYFETIITDSIGLDLDTNTYSMNMRALGGGSR